MIRAKLPHRMGVQGQVIPYQQVVSGGDLLLPIIERDLQFNVNFTVFTCTGHFS